MVQIFSDKGSQIAAALLGRKSNFYVKTLCGLWSVYNNAGYSQWKNLVEQRVSNITKLMKQEIFRMLGPQTDSVDRTLLETAMAGATTMVNNTPILAVIQHLALVAS